MKLTLLSCSLCCDVDADDVVRGEAAWDTQRILCRLRWTSRLWKLVHAQSTSSKLNGHWRVSPTTLSSTSKSVTYFLLTDCDQQRHFHYSRRGILVSEIPFFYLCSSVINRPSSILFSVCVCMIMPSVLWHCWLGSRKGVRPVKKWVVGYWHGYLSGARCRLAYGPPPLTHGQRAVKRVYVCIYIYIHVCMNAWSK